MSENINTTPNTPQLFLIVGSETDGQNTLVGIATTYVEAKTIIGEDYLAILSSTGKNVFDYPITNFGGTGRDAENGYSTEDYRWTFIPVTPDTLLNFTF